MTAKQKLAERREQFTEQDAAEALLLLGLDSDAWPDFPPAPQRIPELVRESIDGVSQGRTVTDEELEAEFGPA